MVWRKNDGENFLKICLFVLTECTNVTDTHTQTVTAWRHRPRLHSIARQKSPIFHTPPVFNSLLRIADSKQWKWLVASNSSCSRQHTGYQLAPVIRDAGSWSLIVQMSIVWRVSYAALITAIIVVRSSSPAADAADIINDSSVASAVFLSKLVVILLVFSITLKLLVII